ncbi:MAG: 3-phosphoserine/phosphohydroxythreonine transaminase [Cytophagales bacterium]|nr:3-phosphoserine/phosphohydroxythreonine transaminase [Cytophagales bacterium]
MTRFDPISLKPDDAHPAMLGSLLPPSGVKPLNFSPGPTSLAAEVEAGIKALFDAQRMCSMYLSHRSPEFLDILTSVVERCRMAMDIPKQYEILFMHGGGHGQFAAVPLNLCPNGDEKATYLVNGTWSKRALSEASKYCSPIVVSSENKDGTFTHNPSFEHLDPESKYVYLCSNETVNGIELHRLPRLDIQAPLVIDASSDFSTKPIDWVGCNVGVLYACASKNIGHPGLTLCVIRRDLLGSPSKLCPGVLCYTTNAREGNLWNTIATFNVEVVNIYLQWMIAQGGVYEMERRSIAKSALLYGLIDKSGGFYSTPIADPSIRSRMNIPFDIANGDEEVTRNFLIQGWERGIVGLRTLTPFGVGKYLRASLYNGVSVPQTEVLCAFMADFMKTCRIKYSSP